MLDSIFGSGKDEKLEELRERLEEREEEIRELERELEQERERAKSAITEKQETDKELKDAKHKMQSLKERIDKLEKDREVEGVSKKVEFLPKNDLISFIKQFSSLSSSSKSLITHYIGDSDEVGNTEISNLLQGIDSETGYIHLKDRFEVINCVVIPPIPVDNEFYREKKFHLEKFRNILESDLRICIISAHAGKSLVGVLDEQEFEEFEIVESQVKGKHSKGGFSQKRFERGREEQINKHLQKITEKVEDFSTGIDYLFLDGNNKMISELRDLLPSNTPSIVEKSLDISKIEKSNQDDYLEKVWGGRIYIF